MLRPTSQLTPVSGNLSRSSSNTYNHTSTIICRPAPSQRTSATTELSSLSLLRQPRPFPRSVPLAAFARPILDSQPSLRTSPPPSAPRPPSPTTFPTEADDDFVSGHITDCAHDVTDDPDMDITASDDPSDDPSDDSDDVDADVSGDDLSFMEWVHKDISSRQKIHHLPDDRYELLLNCVHKPNFLRDNRQNIDSVAYAWAYSQIQRHTYIIQYVRQHNTGNNTPQLTEQVLDKKSKQPIFLILVKLSEVEFYLHQLHSELGHKGDNSMWYELRQRFCFIPRTWMRAFIRRCTVCEKRRGKQNAKPRVAVIHNRIFETHAIDFIDYSKSPDGDYKYILHLVDNVSKMHYSLCTRTKEAAEVVAFLLFVWSITGAPLKLQSDNGGEFIAAIVQDLCREYNVQICHSPAYDPAANGGVERANQTLERLIAKYNDVNGKTGFVEAANRCTMIHNQTFHRTIGATPYENVYSFKPRNRSFTCGLSPSDFEPYSDESARIQSYMRRTRSVDIDGEQPVQTTTEEPEEKAAAVLTAMHQDEWEEDWNAPVFHLNPTSGACDTSKLLLTSTQTNSQSPTQKIHSTAAHSNIASQVDAELMVTSSQPVASIPARQPVLPLQQLSLSQPAPSQTALTAQSSIPLSALSQIPSSAQSSDLSSTPSSTESDAAASLSTACINDVSCEDLQMLPPGMSGPIGKQLADELNVNGRCFVLVGTHIKGLCALSAVTTGACKQLQPAHVINDFRLELANHLEHEWSDDEYKHVACFDGKQSCDTRQQFVAALRQLHSHLGTEVFRVLSVYFQLNIVIVTNIITRTVEASGREHVEVVTTCELAVQQENVDESIAVYHKFTRHVNKSDMTAVTPAEDSGGHYETLAHRDATSHLTYRWTSDQLPMITLQKFLQRDNMHRQYIHRQQLSQIALNKKNNAVTFKVGDAVGVLLDQQFRRKIKSINHNAIMNIPAVVARVQTTNNNIQQYWVMIKNGAIINEMITVDNLRKVTGDKSDYKSYPLSTWMVAPRITIADAYSVYYPAPGPSYATVLENEMSVRDKTTTTSVTVSSQKVIVRSSKQPPPSKKPKPPLRRVGAVHSRQQTKSSSVPLKSSEPAKSAVVTKSSNPTKKRAANVETIRLSPVPQKKARQSNLSPIPLPRDAISFKNRSGHDEIVCISKASKPDSKQRRFLLQWYNEYGGQVSSRWEVEGANFWNTEPEYHQLLRQFLAAHPPPQHSPILIDDSGE